MLRGEYCKNCKHHQSRHYSDGRCGICNCEHLELVPARQCFKYNSNLGHASFKLLERYPRGRITSLHESQRPASQRYHEAI